MAADVRKENSNMERQIYPQALDDVTTNLNPHLSLLLIHPMFRRLSWSDERVKGFFASPFLTAKGKHSLTNTLTRIAPGGILSK